MAHLSNIGTIVYIKLSMEILKDRLGNMKQRGVALKKGQDLKSLYEERTPLYEKYSDIIVNSDGKSTEELLNIIIEKVRPLRN